VHQRSSRFKRHHLLRSGENIDAHNRRSMFHCIDFMLGI
jgi:hypothetical protein